MRKIKLNKCNIRKMITMTVLIMMIVLCLTSCSKPKQANLINQVQSINSTNQINQGDQESQTPEIEEKSVTTVYEDKSQKEIVYGELRFEISPYHIASKEEWESYVEFYCELDSGEDSTETSKVFRIEKCTDNGVVTFEDAKNYFAKISEFKIRESFQNIHDESGIIKMYTATAEEGLSYYMCYFQKEVYLITTENPYLAWNLIEGDIWDWKQEVQYIYNIETKNQFTIKVIENRICQEDSSSYEIYSKDGNLEYKAELTIEPRKTEEYGFCYSYRIYDATDKEVQCLEWESTVIEYPKFVDLNQDGSVDMQVVIDQAPSYDVNELYIWNEAEQHYEKVLYDGTLADISVEDGYLLNWVRAGVEGYVIEKLIFEGTRLIKVSEEVVMPEGEDTSTIVLEKIRALDVTIKESPLDISPEVDALYKEAYLKMLKSEMPIVYGNGEKEYFRDLYKAGSEFEELIEKLDAYSFYYNDLDGDGLPELGVSCGEIYILKYELEENEFSPIFIGQAWDSRILGTGQIWFHNGLHANYIADRYLVLNDKGGWETILDFEQGIQDPFYYQIRMEGYDDVLVNKETWNEITKPFFDATQNAIQPKTVEEIFGELLEE